MIDEERQLRKMLGEGSHLVAVAAFLGKSEESINHEMRRLGLKEEG